MCRAEFFFFLNHHSHLDIVTTTCSIIEGLPVFPKHFSKDIGKTYKACKSICITIKHPGVTVARLIPTSEGAGSIPAGGKQ